MIKSTPPEADFLNSEASKIGTLPALPNSLAILYCDSDGLQALPTLPNSLVELNCGSNPIGTLPTLPGTLAILDCHSDQLPTLPTLPNNLYFLNCSSNTIASLPTLPGSLGNLICSNNQLINLPILPSSLGLLDCSSNSIHCFEPFNNIPVYLNISNNPFTCLPNYIPSMDSITLRYPLCMAGNPFNCPTAYGIVGFTYKDNSNNCTKDSGDTGMKNVPMKIYNSSSTLLGSTYSASNGVYHFLDSANTYNVIVDTIGMPFKTTCAYPGLDSMVTVAVIDTNINFALACKPGFDVGIQSIYTCGIVFPGQTHLLTLNAGDNRVE